MTTPPAPASPLPVEQVAYASPRGRMVLAATVLASGAAFLDATVVNVALPRLAEDLDAGFTALQWVLDGYLLTLGSLVLVGGALGDLLGRRRVFLGGLVGFAAASIACGLAWDAPSLVAFRALQGVAAALLVPTSLALLSSTFSAGERGRAIGAWSGLSGVSTAVGPFLGGWLVDVSTWRWVFLLNVPLVAVALWFTRAVPAVPGSLGDAPLLPRLDVPGVLLAVSGLALVVGPLIEWSRLGAGTAMLLVASGVGVLTVFVVVESRRDFPMLPPSLFAVRSFSVANLVTLVVYGALGGAMFLLTVTLQTGLGYTALQAGAAGVPITIALLGLSARVGALMPRIGARPLLTAGPLVAAAGLALLVRVEPGTSYWSGVLPGVAVFALGLALVVAPVTTTALSDVDPDRQGVASGTNNAIARVAGLVAVAVLPLAAGITTTGAVSGDVLVAGFHRAMLIAAALCALGGLIAAVGLPGRAAAGGPSSAGASAGRGLRR